MRRPGSDTIYFEEPAAWPIGSSLLYSARHNVVNSEALQGTFAKSKDFRGAKTCRYSVSLRRASTNNPAANNKSAKAKQLILEQLITKQLILEQPIAKQLLPKQKC